MLPPFYKGTTDYMDRFIDEQDSSRDRSSSPNFYSLMFGGSDGGRKGLSLYPGASSKSSFHLGQSESNGSAEPVINVSNSPLSTPSTTSAPLQSSQSLASPTNGGRFPPIHTGFKWLKPAKNKFTWCDLTNFSKSISADLHNFRFQGLLHIWNLSNCIKHKCDQCDPVNFTNFLM